MMPISNYKELIQTLNWDDEKRNNEKWYIFLVMNPKNQTNAGIDTIKNFSYLDVRTGNVTFFLPGFSNMAEGVIPYQSKNGDIVRLKKWLLTEYFPTFSVITIKYSNYEHGKVKNRVLCQDNDP